MTRSDGADLIVVLGGGGIMLTAKNGSKRGENFVMDLSGQDYYTGPVVIRSAGYYGELMREIRGSGLVATLYGRTHDDRD